MKGWTEKDNDTLIEMRQQSKSWKQIAKALGRSASACQSHELYIRAQHGADSSDPRREPGGYGEGAGRPSNTSESLKLSFRLSQDVDAAFRALAVTRGSKPGELLQVALMRLIDEAPSKFKRRRKVIDNEGPRVPACWGVPQSLIDDATDKAGESGSLTAELAVVKLLNDFGHKVGT